MNPVSNINRSQSAQELSSHAAVPGAAQGASGTGGLLRVSSRLADAAISGRMDGKAVSFSDAPTQVRVFTKPSFFERDVLWYDHTHNSVMRLDVSLEKLQDQIAVAKDNPALSKSRSLQRKLNQLGSQVELCRHDIASTSDMPMSLMGLRTMSSKVKSLEVQCSLALQKYGSGQPQRL